MEVPNHQVTALISEYRQDLFLATMKEKPSPLLFSVQTFRIFSVHKCIMQRFAFLQNWADTVHAVLKTFFFIVVLQSTMNISSMHMGESALLQQSTGAGSKSCWDQERHLKLTISLRLKHMAWQMPARKSRVGNTPFREIRVEGPGH